MSTSLKYDPTWDLKTLLPHPETDDFQQRFVEFRHDLQEVADRSNDLPPVDGQANHVGPWLEFLTDYQNVIARYEDLSSFAHCHAAAAAENKLFQQLEGRLSALDPLAERATTNLEFALKSATDAEFAAFLRADDGLAKIEFYLQDRRRHAQLRLPKEQELLSAELAVDGLHAWGRLYDRVSGALRVRAMERGELIEKSVSQVQFDSPQRAVRENNFYAANLAWNSIDETCADALNHIAGTRLTLYRHLELPDHLEVPLRLNRMRRETLRAMWTAVSERRGCLQAYMKQKAAAFGLDRPAWYDLSAPYPKDASKPNEISYDEACDLIVRTFQEFSPEFGEFAGSSIENRWIEAENRAGKRQGGFCTDFPDRQQSRIFMTFTNSADSTSTLAHELGHAYHTFVLRQQPLPLRSYPMNLAETASTFAEAVLGEQRLKESSSTGEQIEILDVMLSDAVSFLMNIHARFIFEDNFYQERSAGEVPANRLSELMLAAQKEAYHDALDDDGWNPSFWISKLHFYISEWPFYNFPYTFGYLLSLGVYALGRDGGEDFPQQYRQLLIATGCQDTEDAVRSTLGYDLSQTDFWHKSLDIVEQRVEKFVALTR